MSAASADGAGPATGAVPRRRLPVRIRPARPRRSPPGWCWP
ncbi:hypothetical protein ACFQ9X_38750 [Catenulispora yoronensis]